MSSIVKKSSQFTPKVKKRPVRRGSALSPPTTQGEPLAPPTQDESIQTPITPQATQIPKSQAAGISALLQYDIKEGLKAQKADDVVEPNASVDPMDTSKVADSVFEGSDENASESGMEHDDEVETQALMQHEQRSQRRQSSVAGHRRLSGIGFRRSGSISMTPAVVPGTEDRKSVAPVLIGIPITKPVKKRMSLAGRGTKRPRSESIPPQYEEAIEGEPEPSPVPIVASDTKRVRDTKSRPVPVPIRQTPGIVEEPQGDRPPYVYGIHPETNRLTKFKTRESDDSPLPLAPPYLETTISSLRQIPRDLSKEDWKLYSQIEFSEEITMKELCKPTLPFGTFSENYEKTIEARAKLDKNRQNRTNARKAAREQRISYEQALRQISEGTPNESEGNNPGAIDFNEAEEPPKQTTIKVTIVDNQMVVDQDSTVSKKEQPDAGNRVVEIENAFENPITSNSYSKLVHTDTWTDDELKEFYRALSTWGTDFTFIAQMFPYRTRRQIKRKFILEEKKNPQLVDMALRRKLPGNFYDFEKSALSVKEWNDLQSKKKNPDTKGAVIATRFPTKDRFDQEIEELKREHQRHMEEITQEREKAIKDDLEASRKREIEIRIGAKPLTRSQMKAEFKKNETVVGTIDNHGPVR